MPFPQFEDGKKKLLFFTRGRGRGHAIPDIEIVRVAQTLRSDLDVRFVSYGRGAATLREFGCPLINLDLPENNGIAETTVLAGKIIGWLQPDLVAVHEEFAALPAAKIFDKATVCVTDLITDHSKYSMRTLQFADRVIVTDRAGLFDLPPWIEDKADHVGPILRAFSFTRGKAKLARRQLGIALDATVISAMPGSWSERLVPLFDLVRAAFDSLKKPRKQLIWLAGEDYEWMHQRAEGQQNIRVQPDDWAIDRLMVASDVVITKSNRQTHLELESLGVPSISISHRSNPIDDRRVAQIAGNTVLNAETLTPAVLARTMLRVIGSRPAPVRQRKPASLRAARIICELIG